MMKKRQIFSVCFFLLFTLWTGLALAQEPAPPPEIDIQELSHDYGYVKAGQTAEWVLRVANRGLGLLYVYDITSNNPDYYVTVPDTFPATCNYSGGRKPDSLHVTVAFLPSAYGTRPCSLTVTSNDTDEGTLYVILSGIGGDPEIQVGQTSHDFGTVLVGNFSSWNLQISNSGPVELDISDIYSDNPDFSLSQSFPVQVAPGGSITSTIVFEPSQQGPAFGNIVIHSDDQDHPTLFVSVAGVGSVPQPEIGLSATSHDFGNLLVNETQTWLFTISNTGQAVLTIHSITSDLSDFSIVSPTFPRTILAGASATVTVAFRPSAVGLRSGTLLVSNNDPDEGQSTIAVSGTGVSGPTPDIGIDVATYDFGSVIVDGSKTAQICVSNTGTAFLVVDSIVSSNSAFSADPTFMTVSPGLSHCFTISFTPSVLGIVSGMFTIYSNDPDERQTVVYVSGNGVPVSEPDISVAATSHQYGDVLVGIPSTWNLAITNTGILALTVYSVTSNHANFTVASPAFPQTIASGQTIQTAITFQPSSEGLKSATLTIYSNDPDEQIETVAVTGNGVLISDADIQVSATSHAFGNVDLGSSMNWNMIVTNVGSMPLTVESVLSTGGGFSVVSPAFPQILGAGAYITVVISFTPQSSGNKSATLTISSNDPDEGTVWVALTGTGVPYSGTGPDISLSAISYDFGDVILSATEDWVLQVYNIGNATLEVTSVSSNNQDFVVSYPALPQTILPSGHVGLVISFTPSAATYITGTLTLHSNDPDESSVSVFLSGSGVPGEGPDIDILQVLDFGGVAMGSGAERMMTVCNVGNDSLSIFSVDTDLDVFAVVSPVFPQTISPSGCIELRVRFTPETPEPVLGHLTVSSNDPDESTLSVTLTGRGISEGVPDIELAALQHDFRFVMVGSSADWVLAIENVGSTSLTVQSMVSDHDDFTITEPAVFPQIVPPGSQLMAVVTFAPSALGAIVGNLSVVTNDPDESQIDLALSGRGVYAPLPDIEVSETTYDFGEVIVGTTTEWNMVIYNRGSEVLQVYSVTPGPADFAVLSPSFPQTIAPDESISVKVTFTPSTPGVRSGSLEVVSDDPDEDEWTTAVAVRGTGILVPDIALTKMRHDFGEVSIGHFSDWELWVYNFGSVTLTLQNGLVNNENFSILFPPFPQDIPPGQHIHVVVSFVPKTEGLITGALTLTSNDPDEGVLQVALMGTGLLVPTADINLSLVMLNFENVAIGEYADRSFAIENAGTADLMIFAAVSEHERFEVLSPVFPVVIEPDQSIEVLVRFAPTEQGLITGNLLVNNSDPDEGSVTVYLAGTAMPPGTWFLDLTLQSSNIVVAPIGLGIGAHPDGSVCFNPELDVPSPPPAPNAPFDAYIPCIGIFPRLAVEIQSSESTTLTWTIKTSGTGGIIRWTPENLPREGMFLLNNTIDMRYRSSLDFFSGSTLTIVYTKIMPDVAVAASGHDFGEVKLGKSRDWLFTVRNLGQSPLVVNDVLCDNTDFEATYPSQFPQVVAVGESLEVVVTFSPSEVGERMTTMTVASSDLDESEVNLSLVGTGVYPGTWFVDFGLQSFNQAISPTVLTIGIDPTGTSGFDVEMDQPSPPSIPEAEFEAYFTASGLFPRLSTDIRSSYDLVIVWNVVTEGEGGTMSWDPYALPPDGSFTLDDTINMRFASSIACDGHDTLTIVYRVEAIAEVSCSVLLQGFYTMGNRDTVDVELRDTRISVAYRFSVLPDEDGHLQLPVPEGSFYVTVSHRNHLAVMTKSKYTFAPGLINIDFTAPGIVYQPDTSSPDPLYTENDGRRSLRGGDANGDGVVNILDFGVFARANGSTQSPPSSNWDRRTDFDGNRVVNIFDFQVFALNNGMVTNIPFWSQSGRLAGEPLAQPRTAGADPVAFSFQAPSARIRQGDAFTVDIVLTPSEEVSIFGLDAYVQYDPDVFHIPAVEDLLAPAGSYGWVVDQINTRYDTSAVYDTLFAVQYSKGTMAGPGWPMGSAEGKPYRLTFQVKGNAPAGPTELSFRNHFANVLDEYLQEVAVTTQNLILDVQTLGVIQFESAGLPEEYDLGQNYPNPFNPETDIRYQLPEAGIVRLDVYNVLGQRVATLVDEVQEAGYRTVRWDGRDEAGLDLPSGIYFYSLRTDQFAATRKMVLTK